MAAIAAAGGTVIIATYSGIELYDYVAERIEWQFNADIYIVGVGDYTKDDKIQEYAYKATATNVSPTAIRKYLVQDWARRTAVESRLRNDFPTWEKDRQNSNINSLDFLEFDDERTASRRVDAAKEQLGQVIEYEHDMADGCWQKLRDVAEPRSAKVMAGLCFYRAVTDAHLELCALRDPYQSYKADPSKA